METVSFTSMADGTREDYELLARYEKDYTAKLPDRLLAALDALKHSLVGYQVTPLRALAPVRDPRPPRRARARSTSSPRFCTTSATSSRRTPTARWSGRSCGRTSRRRSAGSSPTTASFQMYYYAEHYGDDPNARERFRDEPVLRRVRGVLRALRPELLRPGVRVAAGRVLRADGEARVRRASLPAGVAPRTGRAPATRTGGRSWRPGVGVQTSFAALFLGLPVLAPELQSHFHLSLEGVGVVLASVNLGVLATVLPWGLLADRVGERAVIAVGLGSASVAVVAAALANGVVDALGRALRRGRARRVRAGRERAGRHGLVPAVAARARAGHPPDRACRSAGRSPRSSCRSASSLSGLRAALAACWRARSCAAAVGRGGVAPRSRASAGPRPRRSARRSPTRASGGSAGRVACSTSRSAASSGSRCSSCTPTAASRRRSPRPCSRSSR